MARIFRKTTSVQPTDKPRKVAISISTNQQTSYISIHWPDLWGSQLSWSKHSNSELRNPNPNQTRVTLGDWHLQRILRSEVDTWGTEVSNWTFKVGNSDVRVKVLTQKSGLMNVLKKVWKLLRTLQSGKLFFFFNSRQNAIYYKNQQISINYVRMLLHKRPDHFECGLRKQGVWNTDSGLNFNHWRSTQKCLKFAERYLIGV